MHRLEVPLPPAGVRIEAHQGLCEQIRALPAPAPVIAARGARRHGEEPALGIERHQPPHIGVAGVAPRFVLPSVRAEFVPRLRDGVEHPSPVARADIEGLHGSRRVEFPLHTVRHATPDDHQVLEHHRRRGLVELVAAYLAAMPFGQQHAAGLAEGHIQVAGRCVDSVQPIAAVKEDARVLTAAPVGDAPVLEAGGPCADRSALIGPRVERPEFRACLRVERRHPRVHGGEVEDIPDHDGCRLKGTRSGAVRLEVGLVGLPFPDDLQLADVGSRDFPDRRVLGVRLVGANKRPTRRDARLAGAPDGGGYQGSGGQEALHELESHGECRLTLESSFHSLSNSFTAIRP